MEGGGNGAMRWGLSTTHNDNRNTIIYHCQLTTKNPSPLLSLNEIEILISLMASIVSSDNTKRFHFMPNTQDKLISDFLFNNPIQVHVFMKGCYNNNDDNDDK